MREVVWHNHAITKADRAKQNALTPCVLWLTGLSGSGKSTIAGALEEMLHSLGYRTYLLDGDNIRSGLNCDLGFSDADREENIRRVGEVAKLFADAGLIAIAAFISPFTKDRDRVRAILEPGEFVEIFVDAPLSLCESRDPKGLYQKARRGEIKEFTGIDSPYEAPGNPEITLSTAEHDPQGCANRVLAYLHAEGYIRVD